MSVEAHLARASEITNSERRTHISRSARDRHFVLGQERDLDLWDGCGSKEVLIPFHLLEYVQNVIDHPFAAVERIVGWTEPLR